MLVRVPTVLLDGLEARPGWVEVDVRAGLPSFTVHGLASGANADVRCRLHLAFLAQGYRFPAGRITVRVAPSSLGPARPGLALAIAIAILAATDQAPSGPLAETAVVGDLTPVGRLEPVRGTLQLAEQTQQTGHRALLLPEPGLEEATCVPGLRLLASPDLRGAVTRLAVEVWDDRPPVLERRPLPRRPLALHEVPGSHEVKRQLAWAVAPEHSVLLVGPPGAGLATLARAATRVRPPMSDPERLAVTRIHSAAGLHDGYGAAFERPFRAPHHTTSRDGLLGTWDRPGEITLAHHGILFLDEITRFPHDTLADVVRFLRDGQVRVRHHGQVRAMPARAQLIGATTGCPCGGVLTDRCRCSNEERERRDLRLNAVRGLFDIEVLAAAT